MFVYFNFRMSYQDETRHFKNPQYQYDIISFITRDSHYSISFFFYSKEKCIHKSRNK